MRPRHRQSDAPMTQLSRRSHTSACRYDDVAQPVPHAVAERQRSAVRRTNAWSFEDSVAASDDSRADRAPEPE